MTGAINWMRAFLEMRRAGVVAFFEVGPGNVLSNISKRVDREAKIIYIFDESQWADLVFEDPAAIHIKRSNEPQRRQRRTHTIGRP
jgi:malonyl CoA-acyl carrier protein transacylase